MTPAKPSEKDRFRAALDRLTRTVGVTQQQFAERIGRSLNLVTRWRHPEDRRNPQPGWEQHVAALAHEAAAAHRGLAADLDALAAEMKGEVRADG